MKRSSLAVSIFQYTVRTGGATPMSTFAKPKSPEGETFSLPCSMPSIIFFATWLGFCTGKGFSNSTALATLKKLVSVAIG